MTAIRPSRLTGDNSGCKLDAIRWLLVDGTLETVERHGEENAKAAAKRDLSVAQTASGRRSQRVAAEYPPVDP